MKKHLLIIIIVTTLLASTKLENTSSDKLATPCISTTRKVMEKLESTKTIITRGGN